MFAMRPSLILTVLCGFVLAGCGSRDGEPRSLMNISANQRTPDEFSIMPTQPLQAPSDYTSLPTPTPGAGNLVDIDPRAEAARALGGRPEVLTGGIPAADSALIARTGRLGTDPAIRETLAAEDRQFRSRVRIRPLERLFGTNVYARSYQNQTLAPAPELERWRRAGARTPAAPPANR